MPTIDGVLLRPADAGQQNANLSAGLRAFEFLDWPTRDSIVTHENVRGAHPYTDNLPVSASNAHALDGVVPHSYLQDYYYRIQLIPTRLALGNVASEQVEAVDVWNAYFDDRTLGAITGIGEGIYLEGPATPIVFGPLEYRTWDVRVTPDGPVVVDEELTWAFDATPSPTLPITGYRIVAWTFTPDWAEPVLEALEWRTDILQSDTGAEQRRAMRLSPRREFEARVLADGRDRQLLDNVIHGWSGRVFALPIWPQVQLLATGVGSGALSIPCITEAREFQVGGLVGLRGEEAHQFEAAEIEEIGPSSVALVRPLVQSWPVGTRVYPMRSARMPEQPTIRRLQDRAWDARVRFRIVGANDWAALVLPTYRGHPVFDDVPDESEPLQLDFDRFMREFDHGSGDPFTLDTADAAFALQAHRWLLHGVEEQDAFRRLLYALRGRQVSMWVPTHADDLSLEATMGAGAGVMHVRNVGFARYAFGQLGRRDVQIRIGNGSVFNRRITAAEQIDDDLEAITLDSAIGVSIAPSDVRRISFLRLMRLDADLVRLEHVTDMEGVARATLVWRVIRDDL